MIGFREMAQGDERFVHDSWVQSFRVSHYAGMIPMEDYHANQHRWVRKLIDRDGTHVLIAYNTQHESQIYGFLCHETGFSLPMVHYTYVKDDFRQLPTKDPSYSIGICTMLMAHASINPKAPFYYSYKTGTWAGLSKQSGPFGGGIYRPLFARFPKADAVAHEKELLAKRARRREAKEQSQCA